MIRPMIVALHGVGASAEGLKEALAGALRFGRHDPIHADYCVRLQRYTARS